MKLLNDYLTLETNEHGEISSIIFLNKQVLHDGKNWWPKTYPVIWPNVSFSTGFEVNGKNYELPKHGFWKTLNWETLYEDHSISMVATHLASELYPFTIDIQNNIKLEDNKVIFATKFSNLSKETAYFHFGHHGGFVIDDNSELKINGTPWQIQVGTGRLIKEEVQLEKLVEMPFGEKFDTVIFKKPTSHKVMFVANEVEIETDFSDFDNLQVWRPKDARFICIEPWQGTNDVEVDNAPKEANKKEGIIAVPAGQVVTKQVVYTFTSKIK